MAVGTANMDAVIAEYKQLVSDNPSFGLENGYPKHMGNREETEAVEARMIRNYKARQKRRKR